MSAWPRFLADIAVGALLAPGCHFLTLTLFRPRLILSEKACVSRFLRLGWQALLSRRLREAGRFGQNRLVKKYSSETAGRHLVFAILSFVGRIHLFGPEGRFRCQDQCKGRATPKEEDTIPHTFIPSMAQATSAVSVTSRHPSAIERGFSDDRRHEGSISIQIYTASVQSCKGHRLPIGHTWQIFARQQTLSFHWIGARESTTCARRR